MRNQRLNLISWQQELRGKDYLLNWTLSSGDANKLPGLFSADVDWLSIEDGDVSVNLEDLAVFPALSSLDLSYVELNLDRMAVKHSLLDVRISGCSLSATDVKNLVTSFPNLRTLHINGCDMPEEALTSVGQLSMLENIDLSNNPKLTRSFWMKRL